MDKLESARFVDICVGENLRKARRRVGLSQLKVAEAVGLTFQQIQKYEKGDNRISCGKLWQFSKMFSVPISYFFQGIGVPQGQEYSFSEDDKGLHFAQDPSALQVIASSEDLNAEIFNYLEKIKSLGVRKGILSFVKTLCKDYEENS